jgi:hypothetical protein
MVGAVFLSRKLVRGGVALALLLSPVAAEANDLPAAPGGTVEQTACRLVESAAAANHIPVGILTRLVWVESRFQPGVISSAGAQGIAQFMPQTAAERGLTDPFDPEQAIPKAAQLLADLDRQFGNIGLAAAAYNAGANRVAGWLAGSSGLPAQTQDYVITVTGRAADYWAAKGVAGVTASDLDSRSCAEVTASLRVGESVGQIPIAPWGVQLAGNFSKAIALASFARAQRRYHAVLGDRQPMIIGTVLRSRGRLRFYRVLMPASSRAQADQVCRAIMADGGACVALRT